MPGVRVDDRLQRYVDQASHDFEHRLRVFRAQLQSLPAHQSPYVRELLRVIERLQHELRLERGGYD
jgi:hypothetical protein